jgi:hypothetical protein
MSLALTKFKFIKIFNLLLFCIITGFAAEIMLLASILPRLIIPALIFGTIGFLILFLTGKFKMKSLFVFGGFMVITAVLGLTLPLSLPIGPEIPEKPQNAAYSLKSTSQDLALFADELIRIYNDESTAMDEMFKPQIEINSDNSWGAGIGIETVCEDTTLWHSGINPGMQSLIVIEPKLKKSVVIMTNSYNGLNFADLIAEKLLGINGQWEVPRTDLGDQNTAIE